MVWIRLKELVLKLKELNNVYYNEPEQYAVKKLGLNSKFSENTLGDLCNLSSDITCTRQELDMKPNDILSKKHIKEELGL